MVTSWAPDGALSEHPLRRLISQVLRMQTLDWELAERRLPRGCSQRGHISQLRQMADLQARAARQFATHITADSYQPCGNAILEELQPRVNWIVCQTLQAELDLTREALARCQEQLAKERRRHGD